MQEAIGEGSDPWIRKIPWRRKVQPDPVFLLGLPRWLSSKDSTCQHRRHETQVQSLGQEDPLEEDVATHSSILARKICGQRSLALSIVLQRFRDN